MTLTSLTVQQAHYAEHTSYLRLASFDKFCLQFAAVGV